MQNAIQIRTESEAEGRITARKGELIEKAHSIVIETDADCELAVDLVKALGSTIKSAEDERKALTNPINGALKAINDRFKTYRIPLEDAEKSVRGKILGFQQMKEALRREEEERIRKEEAERQIAAQNAEAARSQAPADDHVLEVQSGKFYADGREATVAAPAPVPAPVAAEPARVRGASGLATVKKVTRYRVTDIAALAKAYPNCVAVNNTAVMGLINAGIEGIPGIEVYQEDQLQVR